MLIKADRIAFSANIIEADAKIKGLEDASAQIQKIADKDQALDTANTHLYLPLNVLVNAYQSEFNFIDGQIRSSILEQDIVNSASKILGNFFFPNNVLLTIPSLSAKNNVWTQINPFALAYGVGKNYDQTYGSGPSELALISDAQALISSVSLYTNIQATTGQHCVNTSGTCSIPMYTNQIDCLANSGIWTPVESIQSYPAVQSLKTDLVNKINAILSNANAEAAAILANTDADPTRAAQNLAAKNYINTTLIPAINTWLAYADFNTAHSQTTCVGFNGYNSNLLAPTKLHSTQLTVLVSVLTARTTFLNTRVTQLNTNLGSVSQDIDTGEYSGSGFYKTRLDYLNLRINVMTGSLTSLVNDQQSIQIQTEIQNSLRENKSIYMSVVPTTKLAASGNGTAIISLVDSSLYSPGDTVYIISDTQDELVRAIKSISGKSVQLNDVVPTKYSTSDNVRFYKDNT